MTDQKLALFSLNKKNASKSFASSIDLEDDLIDNGYIKKPELLIEKMKELFKMNRFIPKNIHFVFLGENILIRELTIKKDVLTRQKISDYIDDQIGQTLMYPFEKTVYNYIIKDETELDIHLIIYATDKNLLEDYTDMLEAIRIKNIHMSLLSSNINHLFIKENQATKNTTLIASVLDHSITVNIIEDGVVIFGINHDCEILKDGVCDMVNEFIERIANYYQYNLRKGKRQVEDVILVNFNEKMAKSLIENKLDFDCDSISMNITDINPDAIWDQKNENVAYISSYAKSKNFQSKIFFDLKRPKKYNIIASYIFIAAFFIFSLVSLVYLPLMNYNQTLQELENSNTNLLTYQSMLEDNISNYESISPFVRNYNLTYESLDILSQSPSKYILDIMDVTDMNVDIRKIAIDDEDYKIIITITSDNEGNLYDYAINLYEDYGITGDSDPNLWILGEPDIRIVSNQTMEVTVYYA